MELTSKKTLNIFFPIILILTVVLGIFSYDNNKTFNSTTRWVKHSYAVLNKSTSIYSLTMQMESGSNSFIFTQDSASLVLYQRASVEITTALDSIKNLTKDRYEQQEHIDSLATVVKEQKAFLNYYIAIAKEGEFDKKQKLAYVRQNSVYTAKINTLLAEIFTTENAILHQREDENNRSIVIFHWVFYSMLACLFILLVNVIWLIIHIFKRQQKEKETTEKALAREIELNELKSRFVSFASHEFRTPLTTILSSASLIERYQGKSMDEMSVKHIGRIKSNVKDMIELLNDFLSLGKIEEGKVDNNPHEINVSVFADELMAGVKEMVKQGQQIVSEVERPSEHVFADERLLKNVLNNLISNAIKYSPANSRINFKVIPNNTHVSFIIQDHGIGIPEQDQKHMFETFFRASNATQTPGTGLGLCIVKRYTDLMGGSINFTSKENEGTTFELHIPKNQDDVKPPDAIQAN